MSLFKAIAGERKETENLLLELETEFKKGVKLTELKNRYEQSKLDRIGRMFYWHSYLDADSQGTFYLTDKGRKTIDKLKGYNPST